MQSINTVDSSLVKELSVFYDKAPVLISACMILVFIAIPLYIVCSYLKNKQEQQTVQKKNILDYKKGLLDSRTRRGNISQGAVDDNL